MAARTATTAPLVICVGEVLWDCFPDREVLGGAPLNVAYMAHSLGADALKVSRVGTDAHGDRILEVMRAKGMRVSGIQRDPVHPTGRVRVELSPRGEPTFTIVEDVAYDYIDWDAALADALARCQAICFGTLCQRNATSRETIQRMLRSAPQAVKVYDINLRQHFYSKELLAAGFSLAQIVKFNDHELVKIRELFPDEWKGGAQTFLKAFDIDLLAVTRGGEGCTLYRAGEQVDLPGLAVQVADTVGAGDAFTASMILSYLAGRGLKEIGTEANLLGAYVATQRGATPPLHRDQLDQLRRRLPGA